jgi:hypothetical protein
MTAVVDASVVLAWLQDEPGSDDTSPAHGGTRRSGELVRGAAEGVSAWRLHVTGDHAYAIIASYTVIRVEGSGDRGTALIRVRYPYGSSWWAIFAPDFPAPDWRAPYRESP